MQRKKAKGIRSKYKVHGIDDFLVTAGIEPKSLRLSGKLSTTDLFALCQILFLNLAHITTDLVSFPSGAQVY